jgi:hypothetical protein
MSAGESPEGDWQVVMPDPMTIRVVDRLGEPPDETDDYDDPLGQTRHRLGIAPTTATHRVIYRPGDIVPGWPGLWAYGIAVRAAYDWIQHGPPPTEQMPGPWVCHEVENIPVLLQIVVLRLRFAESPLAIESYYPPGSQTGAALRGIDLPHTQKQLLAIWKARSTVADFAEVIRQTRRGPKPGTGAKYRTPDEWRSAIREKVLTKETRLRADDETIAFWLGISSTTMYDLMKRWGPYAPNALDKLRNGKL